MEADPSFNIIGWNSTYDGLPIPRTEMVDWLEDTIERIHALGPERILEIGCGTGMLLLRLAPGCASYLGADISEEALAYLKPHVATLPQVRLMQRAADDFSDISAASLNGVILNSVVQYFPSIDYLAEVLEQAVEAVAPGGFIFVGDVRSLPLLETFHTSLELYRATETTPLADLRRRVRRSLLQEDELVVAPEFFAALRRRCPRICRVTIHPKRGQGHNELTRFRYQAVLHLREQPATHPAPLPTPAVDWQQEGLNLEALRRRLRDEAPERLVLRRVPNARVAATARAVHLLAREEGLHSVGDLLGELGKTTLEGVEPQDFWDLRQELPYSVELGWSRPGADGTFEVVLERRAATPEGDGTPLPSGPYDILLEPAEPIPEEPWGWYANRPLSARFSHRMVPELRRFLAETLPEHMVPAAFVTLDALPLTPNGKIDRDALPGPERDRTELAGSFVAPRSERERVLAEIWSSVLGVDKIGVQDNFFELGGDSILAIQIISRAHQAGLPLTPRLLFENQTLAELAVAAAPASGPGVAQGAVVGTVPLTPIQRWFWERALPRPEHFNQAVLLVSTQPLTDRWLATGLARLHLHHDALRLRFRHRGGAWEQISTPPGEVVPPTRCDLSALPPDRRRLALETAASQTQTSLLLESGPLVRAVVFELEPIERRAASSRERLLLAIHHLVVDAVSWRVLLTDLETVYRQLAAGEEVRLPSKTTSYKEWAERLVGRATSEDGGRELPFWVERLHGSAGVLPVDTAGGNLRRAAETLTVALTAAETDALLHAVPPVYRTRIDDVLLTALALCLRQWTGASDWVVHLEGHGREEIFEEVDLSRTVGWFTTMVPVRLRFGEAHDPGTALKAIKEQLREIPHHGLGHGLQRYLGTEAARRQLGGLPPVEIAFNYLGQLDRVLARDALFQPAPEAKGDTVSPRGERAHLLEINGGVKDGRLEMHWSYSRDLHHRDTIRRVAEGWVTALRSLLDHCRQPGAGGYTPSDFPLANLDQGTLDRLLAGRRHIEDLYPLSPLQGGMLFHTLEAPGSGVYVQQMSCLLVGELDLEAFEQSWNRLLRRHTVLRTSFVWQEIDRPLQRVHGKVALTLARQDWRGLGANEQERLLQAFLRSDREQGFEIDRAPLMRLALFRTDDTTHRLVWTFHHLLLDGWCLPPLLRELFSLYGGLRRGRVADLGPSAPFRDYIAWLERQDADRAERFWRRELAGFEEPTRLDLAPPSGAPVGPGRCELRLSQAVTEDLEDLARRRRLTLNTLMQGAWALLLSRYTNTVDIAFGVTFAGRPPELAGVESILGLFINTLPLRVEVAPERPLTSWLIDLRERQAELRDFEWCPLVQVQKWSQVPQGEGLFDTLLVFENYPVDSDLLLQVRRQTGLELADLEFFDQTNYPLTLVAGARAGLALHFTYDQSRFERAILERMLRHLETLLGALLGDPEAPLGSLPLLTGAEREELTTAAREQVTPRPQPVLPRLLHENIAARVAEGPEAIAVVCGAACWTYGVLQRRADDLAHRLRGHGVGPDVPVGLCVERGVETVIGILAILTAGGAYVPLDPAYPRERLEYIRRDAAVAVTLAPQHLTALLADGSEPVVVLDPAPEAQPPPAREVIPSGPPHIEQLAYLIYTSGSTGRPKGVAISHRNVQRLFTESVEWFAFDRDDTATLFHSYAFDFSVWELFSALLFGGRLVVVPHDVSRNPRDFLHWLRRERVTTLSQTPTAFCQLLRELTDGDHLALRQVVLGGEALDPRVLAPWFERPVSRRAVVVNMYGITETTVHVTYRPVVESDLAAAVSSPIGFPLPDLGVWLLDRYLRPVPRGVPGEILVRGAGLARGYWRRPALTAERFVPHPLSERPGARLYRSGDRARLLENGGLEFLGRGDAQVKIRGFRIEPGEIEATLLDHPSVAEAVVIVRSDARDHDSLAAYLVAAKQPAPEALALRELLREFLTARLPSFMVPADFVWLDAFPRTVSGKLDRRSLPAPVRLGGGEAGNETIPRTEVEEILAAIWQDVLDVEQVGVEDNFFALGGDSILAIQIISRAARRGIQLTPRQIFEHQTIADLAPVAAHRTGTLTEQGPVVGEAPLTPIQHWFFGRELPRPEHHNQAVLLRLRQPLEHHLLARALAEVVHHHDALRLRFKRRGKGWVQVHQKPGAPVPCLCCDLSALPPARCGGALMAVADQTQAHLDLERGPLERAVLFEHGVGTPGRLLIVIHHLVVDVVSWRILLEDLEAAYLRLHCGEAVEMPTKTTSYKAWAEHLVAYAQAPECRAQAPYWLARKEARLRPLPVDFPDGANTSRSAVSQTARLSAEETRVLLKDVPPVYRTQINDILLAALTMGFASWGGQRSLVVDLEGHGREEIFQEVDLSRTVGWFTTISPVWLELPPGRDLEVILKSIKEQLRAVPERGLGFGALRDLDPSWDLSARLRALPPVEVAFNYLGQTDQILAEGALLQLTTEPCGRLSDSRGHRAHLLEINSGVTDGCLETVFTYSRNLHQPASIEALVAAWKEALRSILDHCQSQPAGGVTPSDFPLADFDQDELEDLLGEIDFG